MSIPLILSFGVGGCASGTTGFNPNPEKSLQKKPSELAVYATGRIYPADAERPTGSPIIAEVDYSLDVINLVNISDQDWADVHVWVNEKYVVQLGTLPVRRLRGVNFRLLFDAEGQRAPGRGTWVKKVEIERDGVLYPTRLRLP